MSGGESEVEMRTLQENTTVFQEIVISGDDVDNFSQNCTGWL